MWEIFSMGFVNDMAVASGMRPEAPGQPDPMQSMGMQQQQMGMQNMQMGMQNAQGMPGMPGMQGMAPMGYQQPMYQPQPGAYQSPFMGMSQPNVQPVQFANLGMGRGAQESGNIGLIMDVYMELTVELGRTKKLIKDILGIGEGTIIELDKLAGEPVDILVNHKLIAKGEVVVIDENFGVRVTEIVSPIERMADMGS